MAHEEPLCLECPFRASTLYSPLPKHEVDALRSPKLVRFVQAKGIILREGEIPDELYSLRDGWAFRFKLLPNGRRQILSLLLPGDFVSLHGLLRHPLWFSVQAVTAAMLCVFDAEAFSRAAAKSENLYRRFKQACIEESMALDERVIDLGRRSALERVARLMLEVYKRLYHRNGVAQDGSIPFPLRQEYLADALGLTSVHVSRTLSELRNLEVITLENQRLTVTDREQLSEIAGVVDHDLDVPAWSVFESPRAPA